MSNAKFTAKERSPLLAAGLSLASYHVHVPVFAIVISLAITLVLLAQIQSLTSYDVIGSSTFAGLHLSLNKPSDSVAENLDNKSGNPSLLLPEADLGFRASSTSSGWMSKVPACAKNQARSFLLVFMGHSGSTAIMTELQQHSQMHITKLEPVDHGDLKRDSVLALEYADEFFKESRKLGKTGGFKVRPQHLLNNTAGWMALMKKHDTRIVWNYRQNVMKQSVGHWPIIHLGDTNAFEGLRVGDTKQKRIEKFRIHDMDAMNELLNQRLRGELSVQTAMQSIAQQQCVLPVSYESYQWHRDATMTGVQRFLGVNTTERHAPQRRKATKDNLCELVENWDELCDAFFACPQWRWMMEDLASGCTCKRLGGSAFGKARSRYCKRASW